MPGIFPASTAALTGAYAVGHKKAALSAGFLRLAGAYAMGTKAAK